MYVNNYWLLKAYGERNVAIPNTYTEVSIGLKDKSGNALTIQCIPDTARPYYSAPWNTNLTSRLTIGTGDTAVTADDYCLANEITASMSNIEYTTTCGADNDELKAVYTMTVTNNTGADVTIKEVGIEAGVGNSSYAEQFILIAREVLSSPITIPSGGSKVFTVSAAIK